VIGVDDVVIVTLLGTVIGFVIGALVSLERRISNVNEHISQCIADINNRIGEINGKLEMIIKYLNGRR
jgi:uncharacterized membrane protein YqgA involved in biofilm formation